MNVLDITPRPPDAVDALHPRGGTLKSTGGTPKSTGGVLSGARVR